MDGWGDFFVAEVGAAAALGGLLFVAISLNLAKIIEIPGMPDRALQSLLLLLAVLVVASLMLLPGQPPAAVGLEILAVGAVTLAGGTFLALRARRDAAAAFRRNFLWNIVGFEIAILPSLAGGAIVLAGGSGGLYWLAAGMCLSFVKATSEAWILLVEINR